MPTARARHWLSAHIFIGPLGPSRSFNLSTHHRHTPLGILGSLG